MTKAFDWLAVTGYAETRVKFTEVSDEWVRAKALQALLKSCAQKSKTKENYEKDGEVDAYRCASIKDSRAEYGYVYYRNDSKKEATLNETFVFTSLSNFIVMDLPTLNKSEGVGDVRDEGGGTQDHGEVGAGRGGADRAEED